MAYKEREKPRMLCIYEALAKRMRLGPGDQYYLLHMDGGFVGECGWMCTRMHWIRAV